MKNPDIKIVFFYSFAFKSMYLTQLDQLFGKWFCNNSVVKRVNLKRLITTM